MELCVRVRRACMVEGMSTREAARVFGLRRDTVRKMLEYSVPPGYRRQAPPCRPKLDPYRGVIDRILEDDRSLPISDCLIYGLAPLDSRSHFSISRLAVVLLGRNYAS